MKLVLPASIAIFAFAATAHAAPETTKVQTERAAPLSGGGATAPSVEGAPLGGRETVDEAIQSENRLNGRGTDRIWGVSAGFETHVALVQTEPGDTRSRPSKFYDYLFVSPSLYPTPYDQIRLGLGAFQFFTADPGENGLRLADLALSYTRYVPIATENGLAPSAPPMNGVLLAGEATVTAPTSFISQKRGIITVPRLRVYAEKAFLDRSLVVSLSQSGDHYFVHYRSAEGGAPNPIGRVVTEATVDYRFPFWRPLSVGVLADVAYTWYYAADTSTPLPYGSVGDATFQSQPSQQSYGAEVHARYALPVFHGIRPSAAIAYSLGDNSVLHDGVQHLYFAFYRRATEVYATLSARY